MKDQKRLEDVNKGKYGKGKGKVKFLLIRSYLLLSYYLLKIIKKIAKLPDMAHIFDLIAVLKI